MVGDDLLFTYLFCTTVFLPGKICLSAYSLSTIYLLTCLPWPAGMELEIIHTLTKWVSRLTAESLLGLFPQRFPGNLILVDRKEVVIDQGCSGIRSFQNLFSFSLFFSFWPSGII